MVQPDFYIDPRAPHLGGYIRGGDDATYYPQLWEWLVKSYGIRSVLDVGCGEGHALRYFQSLGLNELYGVDGIAQEIPSVNFRQHDYTEGALDLSEENFDLVWCCEFVEHVEERFVPNYLLSLVAGELILLTHAEPGQPGWHHVHLRDQAYWKGVMAAVGYEFNERMTQVTREFASESESPYNHFARSGLAFERR